MLNNRSFQWLACFVALSLPVLGCAGAPKLGDKMREEGKLARQFGDDWNKGEKMLDRGNKLLADSEKLIKTAEDKRQRGSLLVSEGQQLMTDSEVAFQNRFSQPVRR